MSQPNQQLTFHHSALFVRICGLVFIAVGLVFYLFLKDPLSGALFALGGLGLLLLARDLTITADRPTRTLRLVYRYLLFSRTKEIPFDAIADIDVEFRKMYEDPDASIGYRLVARLKDGQTVRFRLAYTVKGEKKRQAARLRAFIIHSS